MKLDVVAGTLGIARLDPRVPVPAWATRGPITSVTRTPDELSIICDEGAIPADARPEGGWRALRVEGPLDFGLTGVLASITTPLAAAGVSVFALSTFDTDYVLVRESNLALAVAALRRAGHEVNGVPKAEHPASSAARAAAVTIRPARVDDEGWLIELTPRLAAFPLPAWRTADDIAHGDRGILRDALHGRTAGAVILVAELDPGGARAGYVFATTKHDYFTRSAHAHVEVLAIDPAAERRGVARALMAAIEAWSREAGHGWVTLNVFERNARARRLYDTLGYELELLHYRKGL